jgi:hypothetical protein
MTRVPETVRKELAALIVKPEGEIDFSDLPATTRKDWQGAVRWRFLSARQTAIDRED